MHFAPGRHLACALAAAALTTASDIGCAGDSSDAGDSRAEGSTRGDGGERELDDSGGATPTCDVIAGTYEVLQTADPADSGTCPATDSDSKVRITVEARDDGTYAVIVPGTQTTCRATLSGCTLTSERCRSKSGPLFMVQWDIDGNKLTGTSVLELPEGFAVEAPMGCVSRNVDTGERLPDA